MLDLDGTPNKSKFGANAILGVSLAVARAAADRGGLPLYRYLGGVPQSSSRPNVQYPERWRACQLAGHRFPGVHDRPGRRAKLPRSSALGQRGVPGAEGRIEERRYSTGVGDEGGFAPALKTNAEAVEVILKAIEKAGYKPGEQIAIALDPASSGFYEDGLYNLRTRRQESLQPRW